MRKLYLFLAIAFLFQSCFTYKAFNATPDKMEVGRTYKIQRNHKFERVTIKSMTDNEVVISTVGRQENIPFNEITKIKKRKFSIVKTVALPVAVVATFTGLVILAYSGPQIGPINMFD